MLGAGFRIGMKAKITAQFIRELLLGKVAEFGPFPPEKETEIRDVTLTGFSLIVFHSKTASFIFRYRNPEGQWRKYTIGKYGKDLTVPAAREIAKDKAREVKAGVDVHEEDKDRKIRAKIERQQTLKIFFEEKYKEQCLTQMKSGPSSQAWKIKHYFVDEWPELPLRDLTAFRIQNWRKVKIKEGLSHGAINRPVSALKSMLARAQEWGIIDANPLVSLKPLREDKSPVTRYLTEDEEGRLRKALDARQDKQRLKRENYITWQSERHIPPRQSLENLMFTDFLKPLVLVALGTGCRRGELFNLRVADLDFKQRLTTVAGAGTKTGNTRIIPMNDEVYHVLSAWVGESSVADLAFPSPATGKRLDNIDSSWRALLKSADITGFRFHDLRHSFASKLVMKGASLYNVQKLLGHSTIQMTERYSHLSPEAQAATVDLLNS